MRLALAVRRRVIYREKIAGLYFAWILDSKLRLVSANVQYRIAVGARYRV